MILCSSSVLHFNIGLGGRTNVSEAAFKLKALEAPLYREPPHNIEAEQALLGAMLINNDAFHRVADFLKANHFFEPLHGGLFEVISELIPSNKVANPITLKTSFPALVVGGMSIAQYLARLAAEATTIVNAVDYGRTVYDLAVRRELIRIAEDMLNGAFDAPIDCAPADQIQHAEQLLYEIAETGRYGGGFETFETALDNAIDRAAQAYQSLAQSHAFDLARTLMVPVILFQTDDEFGVVVSSEYDGDQDAIVHE
jgi:replicative DNA helicase